MPQARVAGREGGYPQPYPIASGGCVGLGEDKGVGRRSWMGDNGAECYPGQAKSMLWDVRGCLEPRQGMLKGLGPQKTVLECQCRGKAETTAFPGSQDIQVLPPVCEESLGK